ncbi:MAG: hypothetical protein ACI4UE_03235 [Candidatus Scatovivens sp.]
MIYIDLLNNKEELIKESEKKYGDYLKKILIFARRRTNYIVINKSEFGDIIQIQNFYSNTYNKLQHILNINNVKKVCLSNKLDSEKFDKFLIKNEINKVSGNELKKYLLYQFIEYISNSKKENVAQQEVSILTKKNNSLINYNINNIAKEVKNINIITESPNQFRTLEKNLYENEGIILNITNNYKKSLANSNIIINFDFNEEELNKYLIPKYCCLLNLTYEPVNVNKKGFEGINVKDFKYIVNDNYINNNKFKNFNKEIVYESIIMKNSNPENIFKKLKKDKVKIVEIYGKNGIIRKKEFDKLKRKIIS